MNATHSPRAKITYGILAMLPPVLFLSGSIPMLAAVASHLNARDLPPWGLAGAWIGAVGALLGIVSFVVFVRHMARNRALGQNSRWAWIIAMTLGLPISTGLVPTVLAIVYYFMYIVEWNRRINADLPSSPE